MENENYYQKLKAEYPTFNATLRLEESQQESLKSLLTYTSGALNSYRKEVAKLKADAVHSESRKAELLAETRAKLQKTLAQEYKYIEDRMVAAEQALQAATSQAEPKDTTEELLRFMQAKEIRDSLAAMPLAKRTEFVINTVQDGNAAVLRAVESQPVTSDLLPADVLQRADSAYKTKVAPQRVTELGMAKQDLDKATAIKNLTEVSMGHIEQGAA